MPGVMRRALGGLALALLAVSTTAAAATPQGPRLAIVKTTARGFELVAIGPNGGRPLRLVDGSRRSRPVVDFFSPPSWSPDGESVAFSGIVGFRGGDGAEPIQRLFTVRADGSGLRVIRGTNGGTGPVFSPDGHTVAFTRSVQRTSPTTVGGKHWEEGFEGASIWTVDLTSGVQRQLTPWRSGLKYVASSFSPDGSTLLTTREDGLLTYEPQPVALELDGGSRRIVFNDGSYPVYSPDGSKVALVRRIVEYGDDRGEDTDLFVVNADGTDLRRLTHTQGRPELYPSWDPSGARLAYVRLPLVRSEDAPFGYGNALMQINADGTCQTKVFSPRPALFFVPTWQPGPGREAGRIEC